MATNWVFESALSSTASGSTQALTTGTIKPVIGDLVVVMTGNSSGTTAGTSFTISDSSTGGASWTAILGSIITEAHLTSQGWWKIANVNDYNAGNGITVTTTSVGGTGTFSSRTEADIFRVPAGFQVVGPDIAAGSGSTSAVSTESWSPAAGSTNSTFTDALAITSLYTGTNNNGGITGSNTFTGTSAAANLAIALTTNDTILANQFVGGVQASATAGTNVWKNTWTTAHPPNVIGVNFVYKSVSDFLTIL